MAAGIACLTSIPSRKPELTILPSLASYDSFDVSQPLINGIIGKSKCLANA